MLWAKPGTAAEFVQQLRQLRLTAGQPSLRRLQQLGGKVILASGYEVDALPRSTVSTVLRGNKLPRAEFVSVFVRVCLVHANRPADEVSDLVEQWLVHWRSLYAADGTTADFVENQSVAEPTEPARPPAGSPRYLPLDVSALFGRESELAAADAMVRSRPRESIMLVSGPAGVGKSAFAVRWAHQMAGRFPDGQLYVDLRCPLVRGGPMDSAYALGVLLGGLGVPESIYPSDLLRRVDLYRSVIADRRVLVVLDNAFDVEQVRTLLATGSQCLTIVTSRNRMSGLVAREGARRLFLDVLSPDAAGMLLTSIIGAERLWGAEAELEELARLCAYLPLALRLAAVNFADRPQQSFKDYVAAFRGGDLLASLAVDGDDESAVRTALDRSYSVLDHDTKRFFRMLGVVEDAEFTLEKGAALAGVSLAEAERLTGRLASEHLIEAVGRNRFRFHGLLRAFARAKAQAANENLVAGPGLVPTARRLALR